MYQDVLQFWFCELSPQDWWKKSEHLDQTICARFGYLHQQAIHGELFGWRHSAEGSLAEVIVLDQFSRNIFRDKPESFAYDALALFAAQVMVEKGFDLEIEKDQRAFVYMPYMHSESLLIHGEALRLFESLGNPNNLNFEHQHKAIIERFGRYPHRNAILGRVSTDQEIAFLAQPGSSF